MKITKCSENDGNSLNFKFFRKYNKFCGQKGKELLLFCTPAGKLIFNGKLANFMEFSEFPEIPPF